MVVRQTEGASSTQAARAPAAAISAEDRKALLQAAVSGLPEGATPPAYESVAAAATFQALVERTAGDVDSGPGDAPPRGDQLAVEVRGGPFNASGNMRKDR